MRSHCEKSVDAKSQRKAVVYGAIDAIWAIEIGGISLGAKSLNPRDIDASCGTK